MRRVHLRSSIQERIGELIGNDVAPGDVPDLIPWSVQAAMIKNIRSNVIDLQTNITTATNSFGNGTIYVYINHSEDVYTESESASQDNGGKLANFIGKPSEEIVYDDFASARGGNAASFGSDILTFTSVQAITGEQVYLGQFQIVGGEIDADTVIDTTTKGFGPTDDFNTMRVSGIHGVGSAGGPNRSIFDHDVQLGGNVSFLSGSITNFETGSSATFADSSTISAYDGVSIKQGLTTTIGYAKSGGGGDGVIKVAKGLIVEFT
jgi:hypothetical protein